MQNEEENIKLTDKQIRFVEQYCIHLNATKAAQEAGYSDESCRQIGSENLSKPYIKAKINERLSNLTMSAEEATKRLTDMARGSLEPFLDIASDGSGRIEVNLDSDIALNNIGLIKKIKQTKKSFNDGTILEVTNEIEIHDQKDALIQILKLQGKFVDKVDQTTEMSVTWKEEKTYETESKAN